VLLLALSTWHKVGLGLAVACFVTFSLIVSMLVPRYRPQFPGRGLPVFVAASVLLFLGTITSVVIFGREPSEASAESPPATTTATTATTTTQSTTTAATTTTAAPTSVKVSEVEFKINLPKTTIPAGSYVFEVSNDGHIDHDLVIEGNGIKAKTPTIKAGESATLKVDLKPGTYDVYCSVPGHKEAGMDVKLTVT
jgi:uncharacterized cupredoxin-like copper-binding protein